MLRSGLERGGAFGPALPEVVSDDVLHRPPRILDRGSSPVRRARQSPRERVSAGLRLPARHLEALGPRGDPSVAPAAVTVPRATHEPDAGGRVGDEAVKRLVGLGAEDVEAVAMSEADGAHDGLAMASAARTSIFVSVIAAISASGSAAISQMSLDRRA